MHIICHIIATYRHIRNNNMYLQYNNKLYWNLVYEYPTINSLVGLSIDGTTDMADSLPLSFSCHVTYNFVQIYGEESIIRAILFCTY